MRVRLASTLVALAGLCVWPATAWGQADWPTYGGNAWNQRWSGLKQINTRNVSRLVPRMVLQTGVSRPGS
jgi:glucose dehydrogenase